MPWNCRLDSTGSDNVISPAVTCDGYFVPADPSSIRVTIKVWGVQYGVCARSQTPSDKSVLQKTTAQGTRFLTHVNVTMTRAIHETANGAVHLGTDKINTTIRDDVVQLASIYGAPWVPNNVRGVSSVI